MFTFGFYVQSRFGGWFLMNHGGSPHPQDNDYQFQDLQEFNFQDGDQYEFQYDAIP